VEGLPAEEVSIGDFICNGGEVPAMVVIDTVVRYVPGVLGDPDSPHVLTRGQDEGIDEAMAAKIRNVLVLYRALRETEGVQFRLHSTVLYNSIYCADDELLVNPHVYGAAASQAPVMHLRRVVGGGMVKTYLDSFERVWSAARPLS
jgi:hypothetical protein